MAISNGPKRVLFLTNIISPYRIPFLNYLSKTEGIELKVLYVADQEKNRDWKLYTDEIEYSSNVLPGIHISMKHRTIHLNRGIAPAIRSFDPHVVIIGTDILSTPASWTALYTARRSGSKIIRFEGQHHHTTSASSLKHLLYKRFYKRCDAFFVYSHLTKQYLQSLGVKREKITVGYNVGNTENFQLGVRDYLSQRGYPEERRQYPEVMFLFSGRLARDKNILGLIDALRHLDLKDAGLLILGDGELRDQVMDFARTYPSLNIFVEGFKQKDDIVRYFALADIFAMPTFRDRASIVLSEALFSGLYVVASNYDGSSGNFIKQGINGVVINPKDTKQLQDALLNAYHLKKSGGIDKVRIQSTMADYTVKRYAQRLAEMLQAL